MSTKQGQPQMVELREFEEVCRERNHLRQERDDQYALLDQQRADFERVLAERDKARADAQEARERAHEEVTRLVRLCDGFRARLVAVTQKRDEIQADYEARGKVIKKLRKRLHKLKKKLKH